jgi:hypothetical protein
MYNVYNQTPQKHQKLEIEICCISKNLTNKKGPIGPFPDLFFPECI